MPRRWASELSIAHRLLANVETGFDERGRIYIEGWFALYLESGHCLDRLHLRITYPNVFPRRRSHPLVFLLSHRENWHNLYDSHIESDWKLCLYVPLESGLDFERETELERLLEHVSSFLVRQRFYQRDLKLELEGGPKAQWPGLDREHGARGLLRAIKDSGRKLGRNDPCVCGSGEKYKNCCLKLLWGTWLSSGRTVIVE